LNSCNPPHIAQRNRMAAARGIALRSAASARNPLSNSF